jgi:chemotaxis response regulator CheB
MNIAIVNDSALATEAIRRVIDSDPRHSVLWTARDGNEAVRCCATARPDLLLMDMFMPNVDGVEATRQIMLRHPCPILVVTASVGANSGHVFEAMGAGALDVIATPSLDNSADRAALLTRIERIERFVSEPTPSPPRRREVTSRAPGAILLGSSAGGPAALADVLAAFSPDLPAGIVIVQHIDARFSRGLAEWLDSRSKVAVRAAIEGDRITPGVALLAARGDHLIFRSDGVLGYTPHPETATYRPSVDRLFESAATCWTKPLVAALLTGMGRDGAAGLKLLRDAGHFTIAQDEATSALYGMPKAAAELGAASEILPLHRIGPRISEKVTAFV